MTPHDQLQALQAALRQLRAGQASAATFSDIAGQQALLLAALPERFVQALDQLRNRLESSASFSEESCSFSQTDLWDAMQLWIDKAGAQPGVHPGAPSVA